MLARLGGAVGAHLARPVRGPPWEWGRPSMPNGKGTQSPLARRLQFTQVLSKVLNLLGLYCTLEEAKPGVTEVL